ncbi:hypothetical protein [Paenibacillus chitinolyticus]
MNFSDIEELAIHDRVVRNMVQMYRNGELSKEDALIGMVKYLAEQNRNLTDELVKTHQEYSWTKAIESTE